MDSQELLKLLGERIRTIRKSKKMSQERLAELSELHPTYISNIEGGKVNASVYSFYKIATALGAPFPEFMSIPSKAADIQIEQELAVLLSRLRLLRKKKQAVFLSAATGMIVGLEKA